MAKAPSKTAVAPMKAVPLPATYSEDRAAAKAAFMSKIAAGQTGEANRIAVTQDKKFKVPVDGEFQKVDTISGIIVAFTAMRNWYEGEFDRENPAPPNCFAIGDNSFDALVPSPNSPDIQNEGNSCGTCALGKFEKDSKGKWIAPACKSKFRLAIVAPGQDQLMTVDISSTGTKEFIKYIKSIYAQEKDFCEVVTEFSFDAASDYPSVRCREVGMVPEKSRGLIANLEDEAKGLVSKEPDVSTFEEAVVAKRLPAPKKRRA